jgi:hypothetical protein
MVRTVSRKVRGKGTPDHTGILVWNEGCRAQDEGGNSMGKSLNVRGKCIQELNSTDQSCLGRHFHHRGDFEPSSSARLRIPGP